MRYIYDLKVCKCYKMYKTRGKLIKCSRDKTLMITNAFFISIIK